MKNDSIGWDSEYFKIVNLEEYRMVIKFQNKLDTLYSCYDGMELEGCIDKVFLRGEEIVSDGEFLGRRGDGKYLKRGKSALAE